MKSKERSKRLSADSCSSAVDGMPKAEVSKISSCQLIDMKLSVSIREGSNGA